MKQSYEERTLSCANLPDYKLSGDKFDSIESVWAIRASGECKYTRKEPLAGQTFHALPYYVMESQWGRLKTKTQKNLEPRDTRFNKDGNES